MSIPNIIIFSIIIIWMLVLTLLFIKFYFYYLRINKQNKKESVLTLLDSILLQNDGIKKDLQIIRKRQDEIIKDGNLHIQKIGLLRFNPFNDTGGDQSFILALLDVHESGVVISSLHTRSGTRWYAKNVKHGKGVEHVLSDDEKKAIKLAFSP